MVRMSIQVSLFYVDMLYNILLSFSNVIIQTSYHDVEDLFDFEIFNFADMTEHKRVFATLIARNAKDIDVLIESLPSEDSSAELQVKKDV